MKKIIAGLIILNCALANAHEYSSDHRYERERDEWYESNSPRTTPPRYQQNQQPPIQIFLSPNMNDYGRNYDKARRHRHDNRRYQNDRRYQEDRYLQQQRELLRQIQPYENQFYRDDTHW